jgi:hypothetical protein
MRWRHRLPDDLTVDGASHLGDCSALKLLPRRLTIGRMLNLAGCSGLTLLPDDLMIEGTLVLGCQNVTALPQHFAIGGSLFLAQCHALEHRGGPERFLRVCDDDHRVRGFR